MNTSPSTTRSFRAQDVTMSVSRANHRGAVLLIVWMCCAPGVFAAEDTLAQARDLYATAAYDEALAVLDRLQSNAAGMDAMAIAQYRVFCLLALDRRDEARKTIETMLTENPLYQPAEDSASPRILSVFRDTRRQLLPAIVRERYTAAKAAFERKDPQARERFESVLTLLDDPDVRGLPAFADLRTVVSAFRDLTKAMAEAPAPPPLPVQPLRVQERVPDAVPPPPGPDAHMAAPPAIYTADDEGVIPPVAISQRIPPWTPTRSEATQDFRGTLQLLVDERGAVISASLATSVHPVYDAALLKAVRGWKFSPARKQGVPVRYLKTVEIRLTPGVTNGR
jgi:TonB family protein